MNRCYVPICDAKTNIKNSAKIRQLRSNLDFSYQQKYTLSDLMEELRIFIQELEQETINVGKEADFSCIIDNIDKIESNLIFNPSGCNSLHIRSVIIVLSNYLVEYKTMFPKYKYSKEKFNMQLLPNFYEYNEESILKNIQLNITFPFATSYHKYLYDIYACVIRWIQNIQRSSRLIYLDSPNHLYDPYIDNILCIQDSTFYLDYPTVEFIYADKKENIYINNLSIDCKVDNPLIKLKYKDNPICISEKYLLDKNFLNLPPCILLHLTIEVYGDLSFSTWQY